MGISPIALNGMIPASQDISAIKQNDDNRAALMQGTTQNRVEKKTDERLNSVRSGDNVENNQGQFDAKEKGDNDYQGDGGRGRKKIEEDNDGKVFIKDKGGFDITI